MVSTGIKSSRERNRSHRDRQRSQAVTAQRSLWKRPKGVTDKVASDLDLRISHIRALWAQ